MAREKLFWVGVKALIENDKGEVLIFKADTTYDHNKEMESYWDLAGGRMQDGQNVEEALKREVKEEAGVDKVVGYELFTAVISNHEIPFGGKNLGLALLIYRVKIPENSRIELSPEHSEYKWATKKEAAKLLVDKYPAEFTKLLL